MKHKLDEENAMKNIFLIILVSILCTSLVSTFALAGGCPEGKAEVSVNLPNGTQKIICMPDNALQGLANAADHSDSTIVPSPCPCWTQDDIRYYLENKMISKCWYDTTTSILECIDYNGLVVLEAKKIEYCVNYVTKTQAQITSDQWNACALLIPLP